MTLEECFHEEQRGLPPELLAELVLAGLGLRPALVSCSIFVTYRSSVKYLVAVHGHAEDGPRWLVVVQGSWSAQSRAFWYDSLREALRAVIDRTVGGALG